MVARTKRPSANHTNGALAAGERHSASPTSGVDQGELFALPENERVTGSDTSAGTPPRTCARRGIYQQDRHSPSLPQNRETVSDVSDHGDSSDCVELEPQVGVLPIAPAQTASLSLAARELLGFPACWIAALPAPTSMAWRLRDAGVALLVTTSRARYEAARGAQPVFVGGELGAMVSAAENDRATSVVLAQWCARKTHDPGWRLELDCALDGLGHVLASQSWPLERVLHAYGAELVAVGVGDEVPA